MDMNVLSSEIRGLLLAPDTEYGIGWSGSTKESQ